MPLRRRSRSSWPPLRSPSRGWRRRFPNRRCTTIRQSQSGPDEPENAGNPRASRAEEDAASGRGTGSSPEGSDQLDKGLQGRGLVGALPKPRYSANESGKVVIRVTVDRTGKVTDATYEPKGSTISNPELIEEARKAALQARFTESRSFVQGGTITYLFTLKR